jgi:hypothetical protein
MRFRLALTALFLPIALWSQGSDSLVTLSGRVLDQTDTAGIAYATVNVVGTDIQARTDGWGHYDLRGLRLGSHTVVVRAIGYARLTQSLDVLLPGKMHMDLSMMRVPHMLTTMVIQGRALRVPHGFEEIYRRGMRGWGKFFTREQIDSLNPLDLKTMLATIPGVYPNDRGVYFARCPAYWSPQLWIDGQRVTRFAKIQHPGDGPDPDPYQFNEFLTGILPSEVQAMEVYPSNPSTPAEFLGYGCGVIAVWTKRGP